MLDCHGFLIEVRRRREVRHLQRPCSNSLRAREPLALELPPYVARQGTGGGADCQASSDRQASQGKEKEHADQAPTKGATGHPSSGQIDRLMQLDLALRILRDHTGVFQIKEILLLQSPERRHNCGGAVFIRVGNRHEISAGGLLSDHESSERIYSQRRRVYYEPFGQER
jgi:hypothetical protein